MEFQLQLLELAKPAQNKTKHTALKMTIFKPTKLHETDFRHNVRIPTEDNELNT